MTLTASALIVAANCHSSSSADREITDSGSTGDCEWTLYGTDLYITCGNGRGVMEDYGAWDAPWGKNITSVTVCDGVTYIGLNSFYSCTKLTSVSISASVEKIAGYAFFNCASLQKVEFSQGSTLISIGSCAFRYCEALTDIRLPSSVQKIDDCAFSVCTSLKVFIFPAGLKEIGELAFEHCDSLEKVDLRGIDVKLGIYSFKYCTGLKYILIGEGVFFDYGSSRGTGPSPQGQFFGCDSLLFFYIASDYWDSWYEIFAEDKHFCNEDGTVREWYFHLDGGMYSVFGNRVVQCWAYGQTGDDYWAYNSFEGNKTISIFGEGATWNYSISNPAPWSEWTRGAYINICEGVTAIGSNSFIDGGFLSLELPSSLLRIGDYAFYNTSLSVDSLKTVMFDENLVSIGNFAFYNNDIVIAELPDSLENLGVGAFGYCKSLMYVEFGSALTSISNRAFEGCSCLMWIDLPSEGLISIGDYAFSGCSILDGVEFPSTLETIGNFAFYLCSLSNVSAFDNNLSSIGNYAFARSSISEISFPEGRSLHIGDGAFSFCGSLVQVEFCNDDVYMGDEVFRSCTIRSISFENGTVSLGDFEFENSAIRSVEFEHVIMSLSDHSFTRCPSLNEVRFMNVTGCFVPQHEFDGSTSLETLICHESDVTIGDYAFSGFTKLTYLVIMNSHVDAGSHSFYGCTSLGGLLIDHSVFHAGDEAFWKCSSIDYVKIVDSTFDIGMLSFYECEAIDSVYISGSVGVIGLDAFTGAVDSAAGVCTSSLRSLTIYDSQVDVGGYAFRNCWHLETVQFIFSDVQVRTVAFSGCNSLTTLHFGTGHVSIGQMAFDYCSSLKSLTIPDTVYFVDKYAFEGCSGLEELSIYCPESALSTELFGGCTHVKSFYIAYDIHDWSPIFKGLEKTMVKSDRSTIIYGCSTLPAGSYTASGNYLIHDPDTDYQEDMSSWFQSFVMVMVDSRVWV